MFRHILFVLLIISSQLTAQVPAPRETTTAEGTMTINVNTAILAPDSLKNEALVLRNALGKLTGYQHRLLPPRRARHLEQEIILEIDESLSEGEYTIKIEPEAAIIHGRSGEAILHGVQTLTQILPIGPQPQQSAKIPCLTIKDSPAAKRRIIFIDTARHLFPVKDLKILLNWMSYHKLNELHLHLNDDQGWRLESKKYPKLTEVGSLRESTPPYKNHEDDEDGEEYGGFYTRENIQELVAQASRLHIKVIPGFSLPTHASALLAAYPELGNNDLPDYQPKVQSTWGTFPDTLAPKEQTFTFLENLFPEVATLFPAKEIRIHAPDVPWTEWEKSPRAQEYLKANKLTKPADLRNHFLHKIDTILAKHKCKRFDPTSVPAIDLSTYQRPPELELKADPTREAASPMITLLDVYQFPKKPALQATLWSPLVHDEEKFHYQLFPRLAGFAEAAWSAPSADQSEQFLTRMQPIMEIYRSADLNLSEVYVRPKRQSLQGTIVTTDIPHAENHWPELAFDGNLDSFFQSQGGLKKGNHLTFQFAFPIDGKVTISTGGDELGVLEQGILESSADGKKWSTPVSFDNGVAAILLPDDARYLRLKVTASQKGPLVISELSLAEPLLPPLVKDVRLSDLSQVDQDGFPLKVQLTFEADFSRHPELRPQIKAMRQRFFLSSKRAMELAGLIGHQFTASFSIRFGEATSLDNNLLTVNPDELRKLSPRDAENLLLEHLVTSLQGFSNSNVAPDWFTTGMNDYFRKKEIPDSTWALNLPKNPDRTNPLSGGADSAAFLNWITSQYSEIPIQNACRSYRRGINNPLIWKGSTGNKTLEELAKEYQN